MSQNVRKMQDRTSLMILTGSALTGSGTGDGDWTGDVILSSMSYMEKEFECIKL